jgi:uncharacterized protein
MMRILLFVLLFFFFYSLLKPSCRFFVRTANRDRTDDSQPSRGEDMVRDPECGTYVVRSRAIARKERGVVRYYCSKQCAERAAHKRSSSGG